MDLFDDILFLNVVRDPRAQINSINRAIIHDFDTLLNSITWVKAHQMAKALAQKYPDRVLTIRYEDFLQQQEAILRKVCQFFGIEFLDSMLDVSNSREANNIAVLSALWETNTSAPIPAYIDKFKKYLSTEEIEIIETVTGDFMDYYGYEKMTPAAANVTQEAIEQAIRSSEQKKSQAWLNLKANDPRDYQLRKFRSDYLKMVKQRLLQNQAEVATFLENNRLQVAYV
jgi:hypothetical protein